MPIQAILERKLNSKKGSATLAAFFISGTIWHLYHKICTGQRYDGTQFPRKAAKSPRNFAIFAALRESMMLLTTTLYHKILVRKAVQSTTNSKNFDYEGHKAFPGVLCGEPIFKSADHAIHAQRRMKMIGTRMTRI